MTNLLQNPEFAANATFWTFYADKGGTLAIDGTTAKCTIEAPGKNIQFYQAGIPLQPLTRYRLTFVAASSNSTEISVMAHDHKAPYTSFGLAQAITLTNEPNWYELEFTTPDISEMKNARLRFWLTKATAGTIFSFAEPVLEIVTIESAPREHPNQTVVILRDWKPGNKYNVRLVNLPDVSLDDKGNIDWSVTPYQELVYQA